MSKQYVKLTKWEAEQCAFMLEYCLNHGVGLGMCEGTSNGMKLNITNLIKKLDTFTGDNNLEWIGPFNTLGRPMKSLNPDYCGNFNNWAKTGEQLAREVNA